MTPQVSAFRWVPPLAQGYVRDHRVRWAFEEAGLPYDVVLVDREILDGSEYRSWQPFGQVPAYRDDQVELFESGAIVLHVARTSEALAPRTDAGFARVTAWVFAALSSVEPHVKNFADLDSFHAGEAWVKDYRPVAESSLRRKLTDLEVWLEKRTFLEGRFTAGDIVMSTVLRELTDSGILTDYPATNAYVARCKDRPAFQRAIQAQLEGYRRNAPA
jgi:glutathione S-transferase